MPGTGSSKSSPRQSLNFMNFWTCYDIARRHLFSDFESLYDKNICSYDSSDSADKYAILRALAFLTPSSAEFLVELRFIAKLCDACFYSDDPISDSCRAEWFRKRLFI